jgi:uncharacterized protein YbjT (DUF2867 family)
MRTDFADRVSVFLDRAAAAGVSHVTYLSAHGTDSAPPETAMRRAELDLVGRPGVTHAILRPAWFMQNFGETFLKPAGGAIAVPAGCPSFIAMGKSGRHRRSSCLPSHGNLRKSSCTAGKQVASQHP